MEKIDFEHKLNGYIKFFETYIDYHNIIGTDALDYTKKYGSSVLSVIKNAYIKEHENEDNSKFLHNIKVMKEDLKLDFETTKELVDEILDDLIFLRERYVKGYSLYTKEDLDNYILHTMEFFRGIDKVSTEEDFKKQENQIREYLYKKYDIEVKRE